MNITMSQFMRKAMILIAILTLAGQAIAEDKKKKEEPPQPEAARPAKGSLFTDDGRNADLLSDFKPRYVGDVIFVDIVESSAASVSSSAQNGRTGDAIGSAVLGSIPLPTQVAENAASVISALGTSKFEGKGSTERKTTLRARIAARVTEVLPNGDIRIEAEKRLKINKEEERLTLSGLVRQRDVSLDSAVLSTSVADLHVQLNGKGVASANNAPGWLVRFLGKVSPF